MFKLTYSTVSNQLIRGKNVVKQAVRVFKYFQNLLFLPQNLYGVSTHSHRLLLKYCLLTAYSVVPL